MGNYLSSLRSRIGATSREEFIENAKTAFDTQVRNILAGVGLEELRALLRGDPPTERPNPRYKVHTSSFVFHIRPRFYQKASTFFTHTFRLGWLSAFFFGIEILTGIILMVFYSPTPTTAYQSILDLESNVPFGSLLRDMHRLGAEIMVALVWLHLFRTFFTGSYKGQRSFTWLTGVVLLVLTIFLSFTGYLLPWDQLAYWAVTIGTSMADAMPVVGEQANLILRGAPDIGAGGLLRFYLAHVILLPLAGIWVFSIHYYKVAREHGISLPAPIEDGEVSQDEKKEGERRIDLIPDLLTHELFLACVALLIMIVVPATFYDAPLEHHANPLSTPLDTKAPWYFWWVQGLLKLGDPTLMGVILPGAMMTVLFAIPYIDRNPKRMAKYRPIAIAWGLIWAIILGVLSYMGTPEYGIETPAAARIMQDLAPEEGVGALRAIPYDDLAPGIYEVNATNPEDLPGELGEVFAEYSRRVNERAEVDPRFQEPEALMIVTEWVADLKKVTLRILWSEEGDTERRSLEHEYYLHRNRPRGE